MTSPAKRAANRRYKAKLVELGLCARCPTKVEIKKNGKPAYFCAKHAATNRAYRNGRVPPPVKCRRRACSNPPALPARACEGCLAKQRAEKEKGLLRDVVDLPVVVLVVPPVRWRPRCACGNLPMTESKICWCCEQRQRAA